MVPVLALFGMIDDDGDGVDDEDIRGEAAASEEEVKDRAPLRFEEPATASAEAVVEVEVGAQANDGIWGSKPGRDPLSRTLAKSPAVALSPSPPETPEKKGVAMGRLPSTAPKSVGPNTLRTSG